jgi:hypothetical protein
MGDGPTAFPSRSGKAPAYRSGRSPDWLKMKNSDAPAVRREAEEEWREQKWR